jgi:hypothetical protein
MKNKNIIPVALPVQIRSIGDNSNDRCFEVIMSNDSLDMHRTVFDPGGMLTTRYSNNNIVTIGHPDFNSTDLNLIVGTSEVRQEGRNIIAKVTLEPEGDNPQADIVARKRKNGTLNMVSLRAIPEAAESRTVNGEEVRAFTSWELLDFGFVMHGSNPDATIRSIDSACERLITAPGPVEDISLTARAMEMKQKQRSRSIV